MEKNRSLILNELNCSFFNPSWEVSLDQNYPFESAWSSMVSSPVASENSGSNTKRSKSEDGNANQKQSNDSNSKSLEAPKDYIHVRARREQATDAHSLAERVQRENIRERMKFLQDLVPGCSKVTGKAVILDEIINHVQSLQRQVEFLSMKLCAVNPRMDINVEAFMSNYMFQSGGSLPQDVYSTHGYAFQSDAPFQGNNFNMTLGRNQTGQLSSIESFSQVSSQDDANSRKRKSVQSGKAKETPSSTVTKDANVVASENRSSTSFHLSYEQLESQFGKSRDDAAKYLGVSISTFKRKCRDYEIKRWPSRMKNINNPSLFTTVDLPVDPNISSPPIAKTKELADTCQSADVVIKAKFKDETLKFEFCVLRGMEKLKEEVSKRLNLQTREFRLKHVDDDGDLISLTCDEDLKFYVKTMKSIGKTSIQVLVHLISE